MSGRSEYREMTMTLVGPVDGYPVDKTDGYVYLFGEQDSKKVLSIPPGQVDFLAGIFFKLTCLMRKDSGRSPYK